MGPKEKSIWCFKNALPFSILRQRGHINIGPKRSIIFKMQGRY